MKNKFKFIDLFAGIGGFHIAMHNLGGECVFASEMDIHARKTYEHNFKKISPNLFDNQMFNDDIRNISPEDIPDFDVLCAGFPCQPFSQAGHKRGFDDYHSSERGNLFFNIADILEAKRPKAFFLENVRGLYTHDNGNTFKVIRKILEIDLGYSFYYKIVKASDYGLPQLRPRTFMIGFRDEGFMKGFSFPHEIPLKFNMSDVWGGNCSRDIGFTLRVGGRGSNINDRRNWDAYLVNGKVKKLTPLEGKKMQGFPDDFEFPVGNTQAMKQLGNSVAIDAIEVVGKQMINYMNFINKKINKKTKNKGEWSELLVFSKLLYNQKIHLAEPDLRAKNTIFNINKVTTLNTDLDFYIIDDDTLKISNKNSDEIELINISNIITPDVLNNLTKSVEKGKGTFEIPAFDNVQNSLQLKNVKGGNSNQKADIVLDITNDILEKKNEGFGIKSYLGNKPTLLNASSNTNFIFEITGLDSSYLDEINGVNSKSKIKDRIDKIISHGGIFNFIGAEKTTMNYNLKLVDSNMPDIIGQVLLAFYHKRISPILKIIDYIDSNTDLKEDINYEDKASLEIKIKKLLVDILLGLFAGKKWDGSYESNGTIILKKSGDLVGFHVIELDNLKDYLYNNIKLDTPSSTRHRFGKLIKEKNGKLYFKLNLQMRF